MKLKIEPSVLKGTLQVPPSKSAAHRALICAALAEGESLLHNIGSSADIEATAGALQALGAQISPTAAGMQVRGGINRQEATLFCGESGSTLRFLLPVALAQGGSFRFSGEGRLMQRPLEEYFRIFSQKGIHYSLEGQTLFVQRRLTGGDFILQGNISSQYITGLLLALPLAEEDSTVTVEGAFESRSYVEMTVQMQNKFGIEIAREGQTFYIKGGQRYSPCEMTVEGDYSQAAFWLAANALGGDIALTGLSPETAQGDRVILDLLREAGCDVYFENGRLLCKNTAHKPIYADVSDCPDLVPVLAVLCCGLKGESTIDRAARLRLKESDRLAAVTQELRGLGGEITELPDALRIKGGVPFIGGESESHNDHRIAMALAIAALHCTGTVILDGGECVAKSYPEFWEHYRMLGGKAYERDMG